MKLFKSTNETPLDSLPKGKARLTVNGDDPENIWVAIDEVNKKMYLLNHALAFYPFPSWGSEWDLSKSLDVAEARGNHPDDTILTLHPEAYDYLSPCIVDDVLDMVKMQEMEAAGEEE